MVRITPIPTPDFYDTYDAGTVQPPRRESPAIEYWRVDRVARYLDVSCKRVYNMIQEKKLDAVHIGPRTVRVLRTSIDSYLAECLAAGDGSEANPVRCP